MNFKEKIKIELISKGIKLRNKYPPISERINDDILIQKIKKIFQLKEDFKNFYLIITKSKKNHNDIKYNLAILLAAQSSDLLVQIAKIVIQDQKNIRMLQFSIHPKHFRVSLILLKELDELTDIDEIKQLLIALRSKFLEKIGNIIY
jgi:hypothetical protein